MTKKNTITNVTSNNQLRFTRQIQNLNLHIHSNMFLATLFNIITFLFSVKTIMYCVLHLCDFNILIYINLIFKVGTDKHDMYSQYIQWTCQEHQFIDEFRVTGAEA